MSPWAFPLPTVHYIIAISDVIDTNEYHFHCPIYKNEKNYIPTRWSTI
jgi:hypothetical protein